MTVRLVNGIIELSGACPSEDAQSLQEHLLAAQGLPVDWSGCESMHAAVLQVLLAARPILRGAPAGDFARVHLAPLLSAPLMSGTRVR